MSGPAANSATGAVYAAADSLLAQRGRSFHWARRLLGAKHGERATRLYGFCRRIDDLADHAVDAASARVALARIRRALQSGESDEAETTDMLDLMHTCRIEPGVPVELVRGVESDLDDVRIRDMDELVDYCYRVAGTVGLMMAAALDVNESEALPHAVDLGIAMQLTNICRDVQEDALMGRRYLPASLVGTIDPQELIDPTRSVRALVTSALRELLDVADRRYASGERGLHYLPPAARTGILVAARNYREIGVALRGRGFDCWSSRAMVGTASKVGITLQALSVTASARAVGIVGVPLVPQRIGEPFVRCTARAAEPGRVD